MRRVSDLVFEKRGGARQCGPQVWQAVISPFQGSSFFFRYDPGRRGVPLALGYALAALSGLKSKLKLELRTHAEAWTTNVQGIGRSLNSKGRRTSLVSSGSTQLSFAG